MSKSSAKSVSRRRFLKTAGATALATTAPAIIILGRAQPKTLKILHTRIAVPRSNVLHEESALAWGQRNDVKVVIDYMGWVDIHTRIASEAAAQQGHDIVVQWEPLAHYEDQVIDHSELYQEAERRYGKPNPVAVNSTFNSKTGRYHGFCVGYGAPLTIYRHDLWQALERFPNTWEDIRLGGRHVKLVHEHPVGLALTSNLASESVWRGLLYSFGASVQDVDNRPALKSSETQAALEFAKALFDEAMSAEMLRWGPVENLQALLAGEISLTNGSMVASRAAERVALPRGDHMRVAAPPQGLSSRLATPIWMYYSMIWSFSDQIETARQFLLDTTSQPGNRFLMEDFVTIPTFPTTMPNWAQRMASDPSVSPSDKYKVLLDVDRWTTHLGYPGDCNPAVNEVYDVGLIPNMFAAVASGKMTPTEAMTQADQEVRKIYDKWQALGKV